MFIKKIIYTLLSITLLLGCTDDFGEETKPGEGETENNYPGEFSLGFSVSLDNMGGMATRIQAVMGDNELREIENYIDPEKFRVLFFDHEDKFLFESHTRWVKKLDTGTDPEKNQWYVSVPFFTIADEKDWDWERIRKALTSNSFKIALLVNRPPKEWYPGFKNTGFGEGEIAGYIDNTGPYWGPEETGKKDVFDLHHCQYDKLYHAKGESTGYYDFIMEDFKGSFTSMQPKMGATSSWVDWDGEPSTILSNKKNFLMPSKEHPIPMYGIQKFEKIAPETWQRGTTFDLNRKDDKSISLLRSVVRLEILLEKNVFSDVKFIALAYPNIYARCEPMDVWTPTDQLWADENSGQGTGAGAFSNCKEFVSIRNYGQITKNGDKNPSTKKEYQERLAWFYGSWLEKGWDFGSHSGNTVTNSFVEGLKASKGEYPRIFNSCIQRNGIVFCEKSKISDSNYYRYVVYTGERNINDPSALSRMGDNGSGMPTVIYWMFNQGSYLYGVPITDYSRSDNPAYKIQRVSYSSTGTQPESQTNVNNTYMQDVMNLTDPALYPWPLIRNHVYRIYIGKSSNTKSSGDAESLEDFHIWSEDLHSSQLTSYPTK